MGTLILALSIAYSTAFGGMFVAPPAPTTPPAVTAVASAE